MKSPLYPGFAEYAWPASRVEVGLFRWKVPASDVWLPLVRVTGDWLDESDTLNVKWQAGLLCYSMHAMATLFDVRGVTFGPEVTVDFTPESLRVLLTRLGLAAQPTDFDRFTAIAREAKFAELKKAAVYVAEDYRKSTSNAQKPIREETVLSRIEPAVPEQDLLEFRCFVAGRETDRVAIFRIVGAYPDGSLGKDHADLVDWQLDRFVDAVKPRSVIVDVSEFAYDWGDDLDLYPREFRRDSPIRFLVGPKGRGAFGFRAEQACETLDACLASLRSSFPNAP